ncbi:hypothetical protein A2886_03445 [candidate division WWE3 bacterium RIFCSPHIGHO2_01_FULL_42_13]|uniref:Uncharacterized protein n=1 Tax=candidate division WWE3 bacterium RIFCSPHIGHO2_01_FULL_42_13 TaxID=1802617 RepID=A0A1F4URC0_UNCKA|nr:MAG: hypothetical protein A2886_03445 [candidate division WWE3 bacterium RIFCSPHIGHO2_01_FULL_42_13]
MPELLANYKGKSLTRLLIYIFITFLILGLSVGYVVGKIGERKAAQEALSQKTPTEQAFYEGTITFIEPRLHLEDEISYVLVDKNGNDIILLKAEDQKLEIAEGHYGTVYGEEDKTVKNEDYLMVDKVVIKNGSN